jgi:hypothetical protein
MGMQLLFICARTHRVFRGSSGCHPILTGVRALVLAISAQSVRIFGSDALNHMALYAFSKTVPFLFAPGIWTYPSNAPKCAIETGYVFKPAFKTDRDEGAIGLDQ